MANNSLQALAALALVGSTSALTLLSSPAPAQAQGPSAKEWQEMQLEQMRLQQQQWMERERFIAEQQAALRQHNEKQYHQDRSHKLVGNMMQSFMNNDFFSGQW